MSLEALRPHLHALPEHPTWIPYRTSYYAEDWGFCLSQEALDRLTPGEYQVVIDTTLAPGSLTYGESVFPGAVRRRDPDLGPRLPPVAGERQPLGGRGGVPRGPRGEPALLAPFHLRFLFAPGTVGAIAWLARNEARVGRIRAGLVLACLGDAGGVVYKRSRRGDAWVDRAAAHVVATRGGRDQAMSFSPYGNDERQYCSPGFDLPVGALTRSGHGRFEEHHTSADDLEFVRPESLADSLSVCLEMVRVLEADRRLRSLNPKCEPQLGRRGLYRSFGGRVDRAALESALLWVMSGADGTRTVLDVAERAGLPFSVVDEAARTLEAHGLIEPGGERL